MYMVIVKGIIGHLLDNSIIRTMYASGKPSYQEKYA